MKTLNLFFLLIAILVSVSNARHHRSIGFTVDLIHRDSLQSPLRNPNHARFDLVHNAVLRSMSRVPHFSKLSGFNINADIFGVPGEYIMKIQIGTPPIEVFGIADTGSDLTWAQCQPCIDCFKQVGPPFIEPNSSSTYRALTCQTKACQALDESELSCDSKNYCHYKMTYGDQSYTMGDLAVDTFWFGPTSLKNVAFGCGHENKGTFTDNVSGIVGLGGGPLSIVNQLKSTIQGKFSYCLIPQFNEDASNKTSKIHFGDDADVSGSGVVSTPIVKKDPSTYYYLTLENVVVGDKNLSYKKHSRRRKDVERGNIIIDSGTTLTLIPRDFYDGVSSGLTKAIGGYPVQDSSGTFEICYKDLSLERVPSLTFMFDGANVVVPAVNLFLEVEKGLSCFTILPSDSLAIFGNLLQQNYLVGFDLVNQKVSFKKTDCTM